MSKPMKRKHVEEEGLSTTPEDIARQFLADAIHQADYEPSDEAARRERSTREIPEEVTRTRRRVDLRGDAVLEGSLFDDEAEKLGEVRSPELDTEDSPRRVSRNRPPQK